ncbi:MAG: hypothetical protein JWN17_2645 [Frankiales bacterium]|nr:hypothetical protein [Frankiales bacterium]
MPGPPVPGPPRPGPPVPGPARPSTPGPSAAAPGSPAGPPPAVAAALAALDGVADRPLDEHVEVFDDVHRRLQDALAALDER